MFIDDIARSLAAKFLTCERELLEALAQVDAERAYERFGFPSLFRYCVERLKLSEGTTCAFTAVLRKSRHVPELGEAVAQGELSVSQAKRITNVVTPDNAPTWIEKAATLTQRELELEREVALAHPAPPPSARVRHVGGEMSELKLVVPARLRAKLERLMEVRGASAIDTLEAALDEALKRHDPIEKAKRNADKRPAIARRSSRNVAIPAAIKHAVMIRDNGACTAPGCGSRRWLHFHHRVPVAARGEHSVANLTLLCSAHHRMHHAT